MYKAMPVLLILISAVIITSGCITGFDPQSLATSNPMISQFMEDYPNAEINVFHYTANESLNIINQTRSDCEKPWFEPKELYKVTVNDASSGLSAVAWIDGETMELECAVKKGDFEGSGTTCAEQCGNNYNSCTEQCGSEGECITKCEIDYESCLLACSNYTDSGGKLCIDMCGNGICDELVCQGEGCACPETYGTCPEDCSPGQGQWLDSYECKNNWRYRKYLHGNGTQSWKNYEYCPYGCSNSACVEYNYSNETIGCTPEGGTGSPNEINCCEGLEGYTNYEIDSNGSCVQVVEHGKHVVCIDCGNGFCGSGENYCNCPEDCPSHVNQTINQTQNQWLNEYKCQQQWSQRQYQYSNGTEQWLNYTYCGYGCSNGECLNQPGNNTGGEWTNNYQCSGNWSRRKWVFGNESYSWKNYEFCEYGCNESNGVCRNESAISQCTDTDNGNNTHATGTTCGWSVWPDEGWTCKTDYCIQRNNDSTYNLNQSLRDPYSAGYVYSCLSNCAVMEYYCGDGDTIVSDVISCGSVGCINGTCAGYSTN